ncbi:MAG TPA: DUF881 domain-containing protein [Nocardioidaceae bacterium]|nr:DUF881 domain-containing protein [Nocardioidaceae bacterium]
METYRERSLVWRLVVPVVFVLAGGLFVTSAVSSDGTDLRAGLYGGDLSSFVASERQETDELRAEVARLTEEVDQLSAAVRDTDVEQAQETVGEVRGAAGFEAVHGPGLTVTLDDAPDEVIDNADIEVDKLVVHQQDIQAVVNALWAGGAEAMTIQGQRVISTTGIKCVGNSVVLHGIPYSPPYVITAVGDPSSMLTSIDGNDYIDIYMQYVERYQLGWGVEAHPDVELPAYEGTVDLDYARPAGNTGSEAEDDDI